MEEMRYSLDRIEDQIAVLVDNDGRVCDVPLASLPVGAREGKMYRKSDGVFVEDSDAEQAQRERVQVLQNRLRRRQK